MGLKVYDFRCEAGHTFEAMLPGADEADRQASVGLLTCPICDAKVHRVLTAPHVKRVIHPVGELSSKGPEAEQCEKILNDVDRMAEVMREIERVAEKSEDVGERFAEEARSMYRGESEIRYIKGSSTPEEVKELLDEGIPVVPYDKNKKRRTN